jgi:enediyne biosynthesis protein E3
MRSFDLTDVVSARSELKRYGVSVRQRLFGISAKEAHFDRRGFRAVNQTTQAHLELVGETFVYGYNAALQGGKLQNLALILNRVRNDLRGFAFEGAAMGLSLLDFVCPWTKQRWRAFLQGLGAAHSYMVHVGAGWTLARLYTNAEHYIATKDSLLRWLVLDGYGFHEGYFHPKQAIELQTIPKRLRGYACRAFDQGLGRSFWFVMGADIDRIYDTVLTFPKLRRGDLWSGVGLAAAYSGGAEAPTFAALKTAAGLHHPQLAQGAAFAAKARCRADNLVAHTQTACLVLCGISAEQAAQITDRALEHLPADRDEPAYEHWRVRIQNQFLGEMNTIEAHQRPSHLPSIDFQGSPGNLKDQ